MSRITSYARSGAFAAVLLNSAAPLAAQPLPAAPSSQARLAASVSLPAPSSQARLAAAVSLPAPSSQVGLARNESLPAPPPSPAAVPMQEFPQLSLSASAWREVAQDRVAVTLYASRESQEPGPAQAQVNESLNPVLARLKDHSDLEVQSAGYRTDPVWQDSRIVAWRARGAIRLTAAPSEDFNQLVGELSTQLNVESVIHFLSREARQAAEEALIGEAVAAFRAKARASVQALGFRNWAVRSVAIDGSDPAPPEPVPRMMMARTAAEAGPMPIATGRTTVTVSVTGTVVLER